MRMRLRHGTAAKAVAAMVCLWCLWWPNETHVAAGEPADDAALSAAICPIVYPVDQVPVERGYHYLFYGDGFFVNEEGYLVTAAHVLSQLRGGQPYILLRPASGEPRFVLANVVVVDRDHDVAVLRATPNPFEGNFNVGFLPLVREWPTRGRAVVDAAERPSKPIDAYTMDAQVDDRSPAEVFDFQFSQLDKGRSDTELFLFKHPVRRGQSGSPVVLAVSQGVVGYIEGQWLRSSVVSLATSTDPGTTGVGAAVPIHYAIALLQQKGIAWHEASGSSGITESPANQVQGFSAPTPLSLVASRYPSQALFGGEVALDALIDNQGRVVEIKVVRGAAPFLDKAVSAVRTWSFFSARLDGRAVAARIGITFQFAQSYEPPRAPLVHKYDEPLAGSAERGAQPIVTVEPEYPVGSEGDGSVIVYAHVGPQGQVISLQTLNDSEPLTSSAVTAVHQWDFVPGKRPGAATDSTAIVVMVFRHLGMTPSNSQAK
jgi:TonB family protein